MQKINTTFRFETFIILAPHIVPISYIYQVHTNRGHFFMMGQECIIFPERSADVMRNCNMPTWVLQWLPIFNPICNVFFNDFSCSFPIRGSISWSTGHSPFFTKMVEINIVPIDRSFQVHNVTIVSVKKTFFANLFAWWNIG